MSSEIRAADEAIEKAVQQRIHAGNKEAVNALIQLVNWVPECGFSWPHAYEDRFSAEEKEAEMGLLNDNCPLATEAFTYALFGKDQGRTYLALLGSLARALGFKAGLYDLPDEIEDER